MYLFLFKDGSCRQVHDNIGVADILALSQGLLIIFRWNPDRKHFQKLVQDEQKLVWVPVPEARALSDGKDRLHHK